MEDAIEGRIAAVARDREHGATFLACQAVRTLTAAAEASTQDATGRPS